MSNVSRECIEYRSEPSRPSTFSTSYRTNRMSRRLTSLSLMLPTPLLRKWCRPGAPARASLDRLAGDDHPQDLRRAFVDPHEPQIAVVPLHGRALHVAHPSVDLDGAVRGFVRRLGSEDLDHGGFLGDALAAVELPGCVIGGVPDRIGRDGHVHEHPLDRLPVGDRLAEGDPRLGLLGRERDELLDGAQRAGSHGEAPLIEHLHRDLEPFALAPEQVLSGDLAVLEHQLDRVRAAQAHLLLDRAHRHAGESLLDCERGDALRTLRLVGHAITVWTPAMSPLVMKCLTPLMTYMSPLSSAVVWRREASEPALGSD